jgi:ribosomal protein S18 acetylase RimI-like enzyme
MIVKDSVKVRIVELSSKECPVQLHYEYVSHSYYDVRLWRDKDSWKAELVKKTFSKPFKKTFRSRFFESFVEEPTVFAAKIGEQQVGWIEVGYHKWNNTMRVWEFLVKEEYRRRGLGTLLMNQAVKNAKEKDARLLVLETQSCNMSAIDFYLNYGFELIGFDTAAYSNNDVDTKEVRLEMGLKLK